MGSTSAARLPCSSHTLRLSFFFFFHFSLLCVTVSVNYVSLRSCPNIWPHPPLLVYHTLTKMDKKELYFFVFFFFFFFFTPFSISLSSPFFSAIIHDTLAIP